MRVPTSQRPQRRLNSQSTPKRKKQMQARMAEMTIFPIGSLSGAEEAPLHPDHAESRGKPARNGLTGRNCGGIRREEVVDQARYLARPVAQDGVARARELDQARPRDALGED